MNQVEPPRKAGDLIIIIFILEKKNSRNSFSLSVTASDALGRVEKDPASPESLHGKYTPINTNVQSKHHSATFLTVVPLSLSAMYIASKNYILSLKLQFPE